MKYLERLVLSNVKNITDPLLDALQFAYKANTSVDDAFSLGVHDIPQHLEGPGSYTEILFVEFSLSFSISFPEIFSS